MFLIVRPAWVQSHQVSCEASTHEKQMIFNELGGIKSSCMTTPNARCCWTASFSQGNALLVEARLWAWLCNKGGSGGPMKFCTNKRKHVESHMIDIKLDEHTHVIEVRLVSREIILHGHLSRNPIDNMVKPSCMTTHNLSCCWTASFSQGNALLVEASPIEYASKAFQRHWGSICWRWPPFEVSTSHCPLTVLNVHQQYLSQ